MSSSKRARLSLEWFIISARTVRFYLFFVIAIIILGGGCYWLYHRLQKASAESPQVSRQSARFIQIAGKVKVKRANMADFVPATEDMALESGDTIQTQSDAVARVQFVDGSSYTIKPDTTLVIKDNALMADKTTHVQVNVHVGTINLATQEQSNGSSNVVQTNSASARMGSHTEASVATSANGEEADIRVSRG
ncbi:MAG TPA: FecR domain-containing protein, partial [Blastocatellia bacterium]|nr:FecR domain-containing protein [Blastocatellia bacterium]